MASKKIFLVLLLVSFVLIEDTEAGWKFWKKKKDEDTTPDPTLSSSSSTTLSPSSTSTSPTPATRTTPQKVNTNKAIAGAADPGLAIGIGNTGTNVKQNARPSQPNPGTEIGYDLPGSKPSKPGIGGNSGQGYRDWAVDLTGAGEPGRPAPNLPSKGPAITPGGSTIPSGKPTNPTIPQSTAKIPLNPQSTPASFNNQKSGSPQPIPNQNSRPGSPQSIPSQNGQNSQPIPNQNSRPGSPQPIPSQNSRPGSPQPIPNQNGQIPQISTLNVNPSIPKGNEQKNSGIPSPAPTPNSPTGTGGKSWAEIAGGGNKPSSPTPNTNSGQLIPGKTGISSNPSAVGGGIPSGTIGTKIDAKGSPSNPIYSKGNQVTNEDLEKLSESLFIKDNNNAFRYITMNLQKKTNGNSPIDEAPQPLFTVNSQALQIPTISKVITIYDNYKLDSRENEYISAAQRTEESLLVDTFLSTNVMSSAMRFLADKGFLRKDYYTYKDTLRQIWFNLYSRGEGKIGSTGFEHVFLTELKLGTEVSGLHNWIYFNAEEVKKRADYLGYIKKVDLGDKAAILKIHAKFNGIDKPVTTMFVGTSPELEMALYTVCFFTRPNGPCPVSLGGSKFNLVTYKFRYRGNDLIGSAYPDI